MTAMRDLLIDLCGKDGVSGNEQKISEYIAQLILPYADEVYFDRAGNLICFKKGKKIPKNKIVYAAHCDEVGMVINGICDDGTLLFESIGISPSALPTRRVRIGEEKIAGVIGVKPIHLTAKAEREKNVTEKELYIDIGASTAENAKEYVKIGDYVCFDSECVMLSENVLKAKAVDDRVGCATLIGLLKSELTYDSYFVFTRREELGTLGAISAANELKPDICVVCEATTASDIFGVPQMRQVTEIGNGVAVPFADGGTLYCRELYDLAFEVAKKNGIKIQTKTMVAGGTDARSFQREGHGCKVLGIAVPCRYIHSAGGICDLRDFESQFELCCALEKVLGGIE